MRGLVLAGCDRTEWRTKAGLFKRMVCSILGRNDDDQGRAAACQLIADVRREVRQ